MKYISLFSGIEAASVAWEPLGWEPVAFSEIDALPCALLDARFPDVPNLGDITSIDWSSYRGRCDVVVGGSPCQSFSIAGSRKGLKGESGLMFEYIRAVREIMPRYFVWENVPGALTSENGEAFGQLLHEMDELGYGLAWRILDAQFFGVAQRRRRLFLVGCFGNPERAFEILFEQGGVRWDYPSNINKRKSLAANVQRCPEMGSYTMLVRCGCAGGGKGALIQDDVSATLSTTNVQVLFQPREVVCMADGNANAAIDDNLCGTLKVGGEAPIIAYEEPPKYVVRKLMPVEFERLQGFPDGWTEIDINGKPASDTARYKALGNSMAVPVMRWIGERITAVDLGSD